MTARGALALALLLAGCSAGRPVSAPPASATATGATPTGSRIAAPAAVRLACADVRAGLAAAVRRAPPEQVANLFADAVSDATAGGRGAAPVLRLVGRLDLDPATVMSSLVPAERLRAFCVRSGLW